MGTCAWNANCSFKCSLIRLIRFKYAPKTKCINISCHTDSIFRPRDNVKSPKRDLTPTMKYQSSCRRPTLVSRPPCEWTKRSAAVISTETLHRPEILRLQQSRMLCTSRDNDDDDGVGDKKSWRHKDVKHDPEVKSLLREMTQHFQESLDEPSSSVPVKDTIIKETIQVSPHLRSKFTLFEDRGDSHVILDIHEELQSKSQPVISSSSSAQDSPKEISYERGIEGVFDVEDLVEVLKLENARDICVIDVPPELLYAQHLVIVSGRSARHVLAIAEFVKKLYKKKKRKNEAFVIIQGEESRSWLALDMGNIVLHIFLPQMRAQYDIEMLWSVGEKYDDLCQQPQDDIVNKFQEYLQSLNETKPLNKADSER